MNVIVGCYGAGALAALAVALFLAITGGMFRLQWIALAVAMLVGAGFGAFLCTRPLPDPSLWSEIRAVISGGAIVFLGWNGTLFAGIGGGGFSSTRDNARIGFVVAAIAAAIALPGLVRTPDKKTDAAPAALPREAPHPN